MRSAWRLTGLLSLLLLAGGCETTQPLQLDQQTFQFEVRAVTASINSYDVWDMYEDVNDNALPDADEPIYLFCITKNAQIITPQSVPYSFTIEMSILRAGTTESEPLTSTQALQPGSNLTIYDDTAPRYGSTASKNPITIGERTFRFINPRLVSAAREEVVAATSNPLSTLAPGTYGLGAGLCSLDYPGEARIDLQPQPSVIVLNKGDTLVVKLRRGVSTPIGLPITVQPAIRAALLLDGREVVVRGETVTSRDPGDGITFSFTSL